jgi:NAD(P)-dependent dehydrogenase (short-subunit alcohol dehydrogenase family)
MLQNNTYAFKVGQQMSSEKYHGICGSELASATSRMKVAKRLSLEESIHKETVVNEQFYRYSACQASPIISSKLPNSPSNMASSSFLPSLTQLSHSESYPAISPSRPELSVKNKVVVITGGGSGIGARITKAFAAGGSTKIAIVSRSENNLLATKKAIEEEFPGTEILAVPTDITNARQVDDAFLKISQTFGKIDVLVCNSAFMPAPRPVLSPDFDVQDWWAAFSTNILGALYTVQGFVKYAAEGAHILHISSCVGHMPPLEAGVSAYAASKAAGAKLFDYIAFENPQLHVVNVHPGLVDTDMSRKSGHGGMDHSKLPKPPYCFSRSMRPVKRLGSL